MQIHGLNKTTLLDYPGHVAATIFLGRCNFRCPFCHNGDLVLAPDSQPLLSEEEVLSFLKKRSGILSGVCISGGEPTLEPELPSFLRKLKELGYLVKLDTNGYRPDIIESLLEEHLLDYIAMDVKNSLTRYAETTGLPQLDIQKIQGSISLIMSSSIPYEFRTTVVRELHTREDILSIAKEIAGAEAYFLQSYKETEQVIKKGFHSYSKEKLTEIATLIKPFVPNIALRGID